MNKEIQRVRAIALMFILIGHMPFKTSDYLIHGYTYVSVFLVLTGYFTTVSIRKKYSLKHKTRDIIRNEFLTRAFRLFPLMWIWIFVYFFIGWISIFLGGTYGNWERWANELKYAFFGVYNYYLAGLNIGGLFGQYWTLFVEIHFALMIIPTFALIRSDKARRIICIIVISLCVFVLRPLTPDGMVRFVTHAHLDSLFIGAELGLLEKNNNIIKIKFLPSFIKPIITLITCGILLLSGWFFDTYYNNMNIKYAFFSLISMIIVILALEESGWFNFGKHINQVLEWVGNVSASTYVSHIIIYSCIYYNIYSNTSIIPNEIKNTGWGVCVQIVFLELIAVLVGWISLHLIEKPYISYGKDIIKKLTTE